MKLQGCSWSYTLFDFDEQAGEDDLTFGVAGTLGAEAHLAVQNRRRGDIFAAASGKLEATAFSRSFSVASFYTGLTAGGVHCMWA
jgi:hypothetical protein